MRNAIETIIAEYDVLIAEADTKLTELSTTKANERKRTTELITLGTIAADKEFAVGLAVVETMREARVRFLVLLNRAE